MRGHNLYGKCAYRLWDAEIQLDDPDETPCPECLAEEAGDAIGDEQRDEDQLRRCGMDD